MFAFRMSVVLLCLAAFAPAAERPTYDAARADFDAGDYRGCLQKIAVVMAQPATRANIPEHYNLFMLRGECLLQLKSGQIADDAFHSAATVLKGQGELNKVAAAEAMSVLIKASPGLKYQPRAKDAKPIEIVPLDSRKAALLALFEDHLTASTPKLEAAMKSTSLTPMIEQMPTIGDLIMLEVAATGESTRTMDLGKSMGERARELIKPELDRVAGRIQQLNMLANEPVVTAQIRGELGYRGLTTPEREELQSLANELVKIQQVSSQARQLARRLGGNPDAWDSILADCAEAKTTAQMAYDRRY